MSVDELLSECTQNFEQEKAKREEQLTIIETATTKAKEHWDEMMRFQGEYRGLLKLKEVKSNKKATVIEAVPEGK